MNFSCLRIFQAVFIFIFIAAASASMVFSQSEQIAELKPLTNIETVTSDSTAKATPKTAISDDIPTLNRVGVQTSDPLPLTVDEAIRRALENNNGIEVTRDDVRFQETQIRSLLGIYDPVLTANPTFSRSSTTGSSATRDFSINADISQRIAPGGGNYQVFFNNRRTENAFAQAQVSSGSLGGGSSAIYSSSLGARFTQPLLRNFNIDSTRRQIKIARKVLAQTDADFRRTTIETISQVQRSYWDLVFALRDQQNKTANLDLAKENLRVIEAKINAGASAPLARAEVATELATRESDVLLAAQQVSIAENALKQLLIRDAMSQEWQQTYVPTDKPTIDTTVISLDSAIDDAMNNRPELQRLKLAREINDLDVKYYKNQTKPQVDLNTTFSLDGLARSGTNQSFTTDFFNNTQDLSLFEAINQTRTDLGLPVLTTPPPVVIPAGANYLYGGFNRSLANIFRSDAPNFTVGVTISLPFGNRTAKANLAGARIRENQLATQTRSQEQTVLVDVRNAVQAVETARQRIFSARRARENAEIQLDGERKLFDSGRSNTFLLFQRENALANARNAEIRAETDYSKAVSDLQRVTSTTFQANNITVDSPTDDN